MQFNSISDFNLIDWFYNIGLGVSRFLSCSQNFFLKGFSKADMYLDHSKLYIFFSTYHNFWARRQNVLVQAVLAWTVGWKSMAGCSEIMQCKNKLKSLKCTQYISASENLNPVLNLEFGYLVRLVLISP